MFYTNYVRYCNSIHQSPYAVANEVGVRSTATIAGWKTGAVPRPRIVNKIVEYFRKCGVDVTVADLFHDDDPVFTKEGKDSSEIVSMLRERPELNILFEAAEDAPASVILEAAALILRRKEEQS